MLPRDFRLRCEKEDSSSRERDGSTGHPPEFENCHVLVKLKTITYSKNSLGAALNLNRYCYYFYIKSVRGLDPDSLWAARPSGWATVFSIKRICAQDFCREHTHTHTQNASLRFQDTLACRWQKNEYIYKNNKNTKNTKRNNWKAEKPRQTPRALKWKVKKIKWKRKIRK